MAGICALSRVTQSRLAKTINLFESVKFWTSRMGSDRTSLQANIPDLPRCVSCENSKIYLCSNMGDQRLSSLALFSIEREFTEVVDFHDVIAAFTL